MQIEFNRHSLVINNQPVFLRCGAMHYFRLPHPALWWDRLSKLKAAEYNAVDLYFSWDFHSPKPDTFDFTGIRDVGKLLQMVQDLGLYLIARPGPYINAETTRGGLPGWLLQAPDVILRNRIDGVYHPSPAYMQHVKAWFDAILPFIAKQPNLVMIQAENEYATDDMEPDYIQTIIDWIRSAGITVPTMHNDFYAAGLYADLVDIYAVDNYSVTQFDWDWRTFPEVFSTIDSLESVVRSEFCENRPLMIAELQAGWFGGWKGVPYETIQQRLGREHIGLVTRSFIGQGGTIFNHYKAVGGTNWGHIGATDAYTSYDFSAPIAEWGGETERLYETKRINLFLSHFDWTQTERLDPTEAGFADHPALYALRQNLTKEGGQALVLRNMSSSAQAYPLPNGMTVSMAPHSAKLLPFNTQLKTTWQLDATTLEPILQTAQVLILPYEVKGMVQLSSQSEIKPIQPISDGIQLEMLSSQTCRMTLPDMPSLEPMLFVNFGDLTVLFLEADWVDRTWVLENGTIVIGPDSVVNDRCYFDSQRQAWQLSPDGLVTPWVIPAVTAQPLPSELTWKTTMVPVVANEGELKPLALPAADMDSQGLYEGAAVYRYTYTGQASSLTLHAQHIWAVFLNGTCLLESHTFRVHPEQTTADDKITLHLPAELQHNTGDNTLLIYVESLGHHKGFYDDTRDPRGIMLLALDGKDIAIQGQIAPVWESGLAPQSNSLPRVLVASTTFDLNVSNESQMPMGLEVDLDIERVNIMLNGVLVGKYWRSCGNQTRFYLPEGVLNTQGRNTLQLVCTQFLPVLSRDKDFPAAYGKVALFSYTQRTQVAL